MAAVAAVAALTLVAVGGPSVARQDKGKAKGIASRFNKDDDGWTVVGDAEESARLHQPTYHPVGGNKGGYVSASDKVEGGTWYWNAPAKYLGDRSASYGMTLSFDLAQSETDSQFAAPDVILVGAGKRVVYKLPHHPKADWTSFQVPLTGGKNGGWKLGTKNGGGEASKADLKAVLSDLRKIWIRGEYRDGEDTGKLDNVVLEE